MGKDTGSALFLGGVLIAVITGLFGDFGIPAIGSGLVVLGLVVGLLNIQGSEHRTFLIAGIAFLATAGALDGLPHLGNILAGVSSNLALFTAPAVLVVALKSLLSTAKD